MPHGVRAPSTTAPLKLPRRDLFPNQKTRIRKFTPHGVWAPSTTAPLKLPRRDLCSIFSIMFIFGKGMALSLRADIFPSGKTSAWCSFSERAWPYPYGGHFPVRHNIRMVLVFGKGMALSLRWTFSRSVRHAARCSFSERAWPYPYGGHFPIR